MEMQEMTYEELLDKYIRLSADFDNFRKNKEIEIRDSKKRGVMSFLEELLPSLDAFYLAKIGGGLDEGIKLSIDKLFLALRDIGVEFYGKEGDRFDDDTMEAISTVKQYGYSEGYVFKTVLRGCKYKDQIVRHAKVIVTI